MDVVGGKRRCILFFFERANRWKNRNENAGISYDHPIFNFGRRSDFETAGSISSFIRSVGPLATYVRSGNIRP